MRRKYGSMMFKSLRRDIWRMLLLHLYIPVAIWLMSFIIVVSSGHFSWESVWDAWVRLFIIMLVAYLWSLGLGFTTYWRVYPPYLRKRIGPFGRVFWLILYPVIGGIAIFLGAKVIANPAIFFTELFIVSPAVKSLSRIIILLAKSWRLSRQSMR